MSTTHPTRDNCTVWPEDYSLDEQCDIRGTSLCWKFASQDGCEHCFVSGIHEAEQRRAACSQWDKTVRLLPRDIDKLSESETCLFDAGPNPEPADGYAVLDMANPEPYTAKGVFFGYGKKVRAPVGSLVTLHIAIGKRCRRAFRTADMLRIGCFIGMIVLALVLFSVPQITEPMLRTFALLPAVVLVLMGAAGYVLGRTFARMYIARKADEVNFDVAEIPQVADMLRRDWYFFQTSGGMPRMMFTRKRDFGLLLPPETRTTNA